MVMQLMNVLSIYLLIAKADTKGDANVDRASGTCLSISLNPMLNTPRYWVMDSDATAHICFTKLAFHTMKSIKNACITLPNHEQIPVYFQWNCENQL